MAKTNVNELHFKYVHSCRQYINSEGQCFSEGHHYKHSSGVFLGIQHRCRYIAPFHPCRLKSFLSRPQYPIKREITD